MTGRDERTDAFEGEPRAVGSALGSNSSHTIGGHGAKGDTHLTERDGNSSVGDHAGVDGTTKKASLMDKINPKIDSNGDGKAGFMK